MPDPLGIKHAVRSISDEVRDGLVEAWQLIQPELRADTDAWLDKVEGRLNLVIADVETRLQTIADATLTDTEARISRQLDATEERLKKLKLTIGDN